jgi:hypothetical protein
MFIVVNYNEDQIEEILKYDQKKKAFFSNTAREKLIEKLKQMYEYQYALDKDLGIPNKIVVFGGIGSGENITVANKEITKKENFINELREKIPEIQFESISGSTKSKAPAIAFHVNPTDDQLKEITETAKKDMEITHFVYGVKKDDDEINQYNIHYFDTSKTNDEIMGEINTKIKTLVRPPQNIIVVFSGINAEEKTGVVSILSDSAINQFIEKLKNYYPTQKVVRGYENIKNLSVFAIVFHYLYTSKLASDNEIKQSAKTHSDIDHYVLDTRNPIGTDADNIKYRNSLDKLVEST